MGQFNNPRQVMNLSSTTDTKLIAASYHTSNAAPGIPYGVPRSSLVMVEAHRANGSAMTAVKYKVLGSRTGAAGTWVPLRIVLASDVLGTVVEEASVSISNNSTSYDGLETADGRDWPFIDVQAKAVTADAAAGDYAKAWLPPIV